MKPRYFKLARFTFLTLIVLGIIFDGSLVYAQTGAITLKCEHMISPMGVDELHPRLSWQINDQRQGAAQSAYAVIVSKNAAGLQGNTETVWNTGQVKSSLSLIT